jgi:hypothetical protein
MALAQVIILGSKISMNTYHWVKQVVIQLKCNNPNTVRSAIKVVYACAGYSMVIMPIVLCEETDDSC